ncbi:uncharacterized protein EI90DRAFT_2859128, partial [Cantharellus anzutake]|uniref:uncharacterized protein n=1 Tax=Cantharellus anzutake TaxID=1750568 RepID=UPI0019077E93
SGSPPTSPPLSGLTSCSPMPTKSLLNSVAGAAHYSGMATEEGIHEQFEPTFADGEDRTELGPVRQAILDSVLALYSGNPSIEIFSTYWRKDAVFEDPLTLCHGYREYAAQVSHFAKFVSKTVTVSHRVLASTTSPSRIVYSQVQEYTFKFMKQKKTIHSMVVIHLDREEKIIKLEDKWKGIDQPHKYGALFFRRLNAKTLPFLIKYPK